MIFLNQDATKLEDLFINDEWRLVQLYKNIYNLEVKGRELGWIVKVYDKKKYAKQESVNLNKLKKFTGFPTVLATGFSSSLNYNVISKVKGVDLHDYCNKKKNITEPEAKVIAKQILTLLCKVHSKKIIHGDIKPENIIYNPKTKVVTIIDFEGKYTREYASPEQVFNGRVTDKTDTWSVGVVIYWLLDKTHPFKGFRELRDKRISYPSWWSSDLKDFLSCLLERDVTLRYDCEEALNHPWFN
jgi:serine/threonine protein kinase